MFDNQLAESPSCGQIMPLSLLDGLKQRQMRLQSDLDKVNEAIEALSKNPEIASVIEKISKIRGL